MKYLSSVTIVIAALTWFAIYVRASEEEGGLEISVALAESPNKEERAVGESERRERLKGEWDQISPEERREAYQQATAMSHLFLPQAWAEFEEGPVGQRPWVPIGPGNVGGRVRSIIIHPENPSIMWIGAVSGGVWKTTNGGDSWTTNTDFLSTLAINCMVIDPEDPRTLYAGTGEGFFNSDAVPGDGIFKTIDGGEHWFQLTNTRTLSENDDFAYVNRLAISPADSQVLLAVTRSGKILRSTNAGEDWSTQLDTDNDIAMVDVRFRPLNQGEPPQTPITCVAATRNGRVYYSSDDGQTWTVATGLPVPGPNSGEHRVELAYSPSSPSIVYASAAADGHLYKSINGGSSFINVGAPPDGTGVSWYNNSGACPKNS